MIKGLFLVFALLVLPLVSAQEVFDGDTVYINDSRAYISATPHTIKGVQPVEIEVLSKQFTGNVNIVFGYNGEYLRPFKLERFNPHQECVTYDEGLGNETTVCTDYNWTAITSTQAGFTSVKRDLLGKTDWYYRTNFPVVAGTTYKVRVWIESPTIPFGMTQEQVYPDYDGKYDIAIYPSSYGANLIGAYNDGNMYVLDPVVDLTTDLIGYWDLDADCTDTHGSKDFTTDNWVAGQGIINDGITSSTTQYCGDSNVNFLSSSHLTDFTINAWANVSTLVTTNRHGAVFETYSNSGSIAVFVNTVNKYDCSIIMGGSWHECSSTTSPSVGDMTMVSCAWNDTSKTMKTYVDGSLENTCTYSGSGTTQAIGTNIGNTFNNFKGVIDEVGVWSTTLDSTDISTLYNSGAGLAYPFSASNFTVTAQNSVNLTSLNDFNVTIEGSTYDAVNGTATTGLIVNSSQLYNLSVSAVDYFTSYYYDQNLSSNTFEANLTQAYITYACFEKITNSSLTCSPSATLEFNSGNYSEQVNVTGYYPQTTNFSVSPLDNSTISVYDFADSYVYVTAIAKNNGTSLNDFDLLITDLNNSWSKAVNVSGVNHNETLLSGGNYSIYFTKAGYEAKNASFSSFASQNYEFEVYPANSVNITIRKESDLALVTDEVTIRFVDLNETVSTYSTSTGYKYISGLSATNYTISFISTNYSTRTYDLSLDNDFQAFTIYLIASGSSNTIFTFQDADDGSRLEGVTLSVLKLINTTWTLVESLSSDITGRTSFDYSTDVAYRFVATYDNYQDRNWTLDPILFNSYIIKLNKDFNLEDNSDFNGVQVYFEPKGFTDDTNTTINFTFSNPSATFVDYGFNATWNGVDYVQDSGSTEIGSVLNATLEISGAELNDLVTIMFYYELENGEVYSFTRNYLISVNDGIKDSLGERYGLGLLERVLIVVGFALLVAGASAYYGGALAGGVMAMFVFGFFGMTGFLEWWLVLPSLIVMFIIATWRSST